MDAKPLGGGEAERIRQLVVARFGGRVRDYRVLVSGNGLVVQGRVVSFYPKQFIQETVVRATPFLVVSNDVVVD